VDDYLGKNHYQLPNLGNGIKRSGWEEGCSKMYVNRSTQDSFIQEDGEDITTKPWKWDSEIRMGRRLF
jgi:hypothetical protein